MNLKKIIRKINSQKKNWKQKISAGYFRITFYCSWCCFFIFKRFKKREIKMIFWGIYLRFSSISRFSAECDRLAWPVPKTRLTFVRTRSRAVSVNLFKKFIFYDTQERDFCWIWGRKFWDFFYHKKYVKWIIIKRGDWTSLTHQ